MAFLPRHFQLVRRLVELRGRSLPITNHRVTSLRLTPTPVRNLLTDSFSRRHTYLRISLTERCNLRCQYCMPEEGVPLSDAPLSTEETLQLARVFAGLGVRKVRLTGGEPLLNKDISRIVGELKRTGGIESVSLTTNGVTLSRHLPALLAAGLDNVNISLDSLVPAKFSFISRRPVGTLSKVLRGIDDAVASDIKSIKLNVVVMKGFNDDEICDFVDFVRERPVSVRFLEFMPFSGNAWESPKFLPFDQQRRVIEERFGPLTRLVDCSSSTSMNYSLPGYTGTVGFISSMSRNFCAGCNRLRLTHDGMLKVCLFGEDEVSLREILRDRSLSEEQRTELLYTAISSAVKKKKFSHGGVESIKEQMKRPMILIGG